MVINFKHTFTSIVTVIVLVVSLTSDKKSKYFGVFCLAAPRSFQSTHELQESKEVF